ncbi:MULTISPECIES: hypothetical protein [unclassified Rhizobium]|uniref:hypothetical protein n=1 Tax=unclassified Rhizobium TaxID=2613769 RepID=UPI001160AA5B|nr:MULTISPECIES: hypothetical protein [unclassified Rhizobium]TQX87150.1 hypothetical protein EQW76_14925 [Rhizobium sp. rho-13.1]TQY14227.1 hypothetical protein EQW74_13695 [Rhizobium sp. rho-1.1]
MADLTNNSWNENDSQNTAASPNGLATGSLPSNIPAVIRMMMGALKRFFDRHNNVAVVANTGNDYTLTYSVAPDGYVKGEEYTFFVNATNTGPATLNINGLGTKALLAQGGGALTSGDLLASASVSVVYDGTAFRLKGPSFNPSLGNMNASALNVAGSPVLTSANFTAATYVPQSSYVSYQSAVQAALNTKQNNLGYAPVSRTGDAMSGDLNLTRASASPGLFFTASGVRQWYLQANSDAFFRVVDASAGAEAFRVGPSGELWCRQFGDVNSQIENRAQAWATDRAVAYSNNCVQQSQAAGYVEASIKTGSGGGGDINNGGYYICRIYKSGTEQINAASRQLQLYVPSRGWFAAFPF